MNHEQSASIKRKDGTAVTVNEILDLLAEFKRCIEYDHYSADIDAGMPYRSMEDIKADPLIEVTPAHALVCEILEANGYKEQTQ